MGFGPFGGLLGLVLFVFIVYVIAKLVMSLFSNPNANPDRQDSLTILKNRFAKGEITQEEYKRMKEVIKININNSVFEEIITVYISDFNQIYFTRGFTSQY